jgi:hypothetical protein
MDVCKNTHSYWSERSSILAITALLSLDDNWNRITLGTDLKNKLLQIPAFNKISFIEPNSNLFAPLLCGHELVECSYILK